MGFEEGRKKKVDPFARLRKSPVFEDSQKYYPPGWTTQDLVADPKFVKLADSPDKASDLRLSKGSPAIDAGVVIPAKWPDPLAAADKGKPDIGTIPVGVKLWGVGVNGRIPLFGGTKQKAP